MAASSVSPRTVNLLYSLGALLVIGLSIPLLLEKIPPNGLYGFRIEKTMNNPDLWYRANKILGMDLLLAGVVMLLATIGLFVAGKKLSMNQVALINLGVTVVALGAAIAHSAIAVAGM